MPVVSVRPGDVIADKYEVEKVLAAGGMGVVLSAQHLQLKRRVALKFLLPELCEAPGIVARFLREAQAMTAIQNEHVARVLDVGKTAEGSPYMVMEYLEGEDLGQTLERRGRLPVPDAIDYVLQAMEALAEAHTNGFVHRDLKPSNLFMTQRPDGSPLVKVLDFGISKALAEKEQDANLTQTRGMLGSPLYMAPEQIRNSKKVDIRADIWTLGVILHELIAGKSPFENDTENVAAVLAAIMADDPPRLDSLRDDIPRGLSEVVLRCLSRNRDDRYPTVGALASALTPFAPADSKVSIDRIRRVIDHHQRTESAPNLGAVTIAKGLVTPRPEDDGWGPAAQLETTAAAPSSDPAIPISSSPRSGEGAVRVRTPGRKDDTPTGDTTFGKYKLIALLGQGGMADVFLAVLGGPEGLGFSKLVVLKRLRANLANDKEFVSMLVDEARIAAKLNHPNVVQTHEVGVIDGEYYIAMEYLEGQPLSLVVQRAASGEPLSLAFKLGIVRDMLAGVHHAHQLVDFDGKPLGLVHRDVTPQNVFVTYEGQVKVVDFGIAKARGRATETQQGILKGKVRYMSPEQAAGGDIDGRTDVFAAGVLLWELLAGQRMWKDVDDVAIIQKLMLDKIPSSPREVNPDVPKALDAIVKKALARKPSDRYASAEALQLDIERFMESEGLKCAPRDLGGYVATMFADRRKQARSLIEGQLSKLRESESPQSLRVLKMRDSGSAGASSQQPQRPSGTPLERLDRDPLPESGRDSSRNAILARSDPGHSASGTGPMARQRSRLPFVGGLVAVVAAVVVIGMLARNKDNQRPPVTADTASVPPVVTSVVASAVVSAAPLATSTTSATPPNEGPIQVSLNAGAPRAEFSIDNGPKIKSPATLTRPRDGKSHRITATAPGYRPETTTVTFDKDVAWAVVLVGAHVKDGSKPAASTTTAESPSATAPATAPAPTGSGRKKRELDPDNPYANQPQPQ